MTFLLILFIIIWVLYYLPRIVLWVLKIVVNRKLRRVYNAAGANRGGSDAPRYGRHEEDNQMHRPKKKIDSDVGEYVRFEEIEVTQTTQTVSDTDGNTVRETQTVIEEQIVDVEWEDV